MDGLVHPLFQARFMDDLGDPGLPLGLRRGLREAGFGGVPEGLPYGQLRVEDVVLRDQADALAQLREVPVEVAAVVEDGAGVGRAQPGQGVEQRRLPRPAGPDDPEQALLPDGERDLVQQGLAAPARPSDVDLQILHVERHLTGVDELLEHIPDEAEGGVADADDVSGLDDRPVDGLAVEEGAVVAAEVDDLVPAVGERPQLGVAPGDHEVVARVAADADGLRGQRPYGGGLPEGAGGGGHGDGGGPVGGGRMGRGFAAHEHGAGPSPGLPKRVTVPAPTSDVWTR